MIISMIKPTIFALALTIANCQMPLRNSSAETIAPSEVYVVDGDSIRVHDRSIRLVGFKRAGDLARGLPSRTSTRNQSHTPPARARARRQA